MFLRLRWRCRLGEARGSDAVYGVPRGKRPNNSIHASLGCRIGAHAWQTTIAEPDERRCEHHRTRPASGGEIYGHNRVPFSMAIETIGVNWPAM